MGEQGTTKRYAVRFVRQHNARRACVPVQDGDAPPQPPGRLPRVTKLMALAIRFEHLIQTGAVRDQTDLAELGHVTTARVTQIMNLLHLAPDIQEAILNLPRVIQGRDPIAERYVRPVAAIIDWHTQRRLWRELLGTAG
jgi:hypothetical protein